jgi:formylglycine-generating enzyme required for sulfatase activity
VKPRQLFWLLAVPICTVAALGQGTTSAPASGRVPGTVFRDCPECPEMVVIAAGRFAMGSPEVDKAWAVSHGASKESVADESPQHTVTLRSFALGKYDVTRGEYAAFVRETGHPEGDGCYAFDGSHWNSSVWPKSPGTSWQNPGFGQTDRDPVVCVTWPDARAYVSGLNGKVRRAGPAAGDGPYRLPSESEWEYAGRGGKTTRFWWGDNDTNAGQYAWYNANAGGHTHPVGSAPANPFGLYDMVGDAWQWNEDCYAESYASAPANGSAAEAGGSGCLRVDRGGSWAYPSWLLRAATRERNPAGYRDNVLGFRVAKTLP